MSRPQAIDGSRGLVLWESPSARPVAVRIAIAGDFLPAGNLVLPSSRDPWRKMAARIASHFEDAAIYFLNLECTLGASGLPARPLAGLGDIVSAPVASLDYLNAIGSPVVGLANNHSYDYYAKGVEQTRRTLLARRMPALGAGYSLRASPEVFVWQGGGGVRVGFWAAALASSDLASRNSTGVEPATLDRARQAIDILRARGAQFSIALLHAGAIRTNRPEPNERKRIDSIAVQGFDVVACSHSHRISGWRITPANDDQPRFCFYGLGSIVSGFTASPLEREGLIIVAALDSSGAPVTIEARPVLLEASGFGEIPRPEAARVILDRFRELSREIADGSSSQLFYQDVAQGLIGLYARDISTAFHRSGLRGLARKAARLRLRHIRRLVHRVTG